MISLTVISVYIIVCLILFGLTPSLSATHYKWLEKWKFWGYGIFPTTMLTWAILVIEENPELFWGGFGIFFVGIYCMFEDKKHKQIGIIHYVGALVGIGYMMYIVGLWYWPLILIWTILSVISLFSKYRVYIIEILAIIVLYIYKIGA